MNARFVFLGIAAWNTVVAIINATVVTRMVSPEALIYMTPTSQLLPILIPLGAYALFFRPVRATIRISR